MVLGSPPFGEVAHQASALAEVEFLVKFLGYLSRLEVARNVPQVGLSCQTFQKHGTCTAALVVGMGVKEPEIWSLESAPLGSSRSPTARVELTSMALAGPTFVISGSDAAKEELTRLWVRSGAQLKWGKFLAVFVSEIPLCESDAPCVVAEIRVDNLQKASFRVVSQFLCEFVGAGVPTLGVGGERTREEDAL